MNLHESMSESGTQLSEPDGKKYARMRGRLLATLIAMALILVVALILALEVTGYTRLLAIGV